MQTGYIDKLTTPIGEEFAPQFWPHLSPQQMLEMSVFEGKYCNDYRDEFPSS
jgi:hypothetical protein